MQQHWRFKICLLLLCPKCTKESEGSSYHSAQALSLFSNFENCSPGPGITLVSPKEPRFAFSLLSLMRLPSLSFT